MSGTRLVVLGARGSIPVSGTEFVRYGGNTSCFALVVDDVAVAFIDAGTGLVAHRNAGIRLGPKVSIFLTHYHWDHIQGLSMLDEMWKGACDIRVYGQGDPGIILSRAIAPPWFPVAISDVSLVRFESVGGPVEFPGVSVTSFDVNHPQGAVGFRLDGMNRSIAIVTDHEAGTSVDGSIALAIDGVDVLVHDAQYLPSEKSGHSGWGHSTYVDAIAMARNAGASELVLTSHDPNRSDEAVDQMIDEAQETFPDVSGAYQGMVLDL